MKQENQDTLERQKGKKRYIKPEITSEPLCSDMALCGCLPPDGIGKMGMMDCQRYGRPAVGPS